NEGRTTGARRGGEDRVDRRVPPGDDRRRDADGLRGRCERGGPAPLELGSRGGGGDLEVDLGEHRARRLTAERTAERAGIAPGPFAWALVFASASGCCSRVGLRFSIRPPAAVAAGRPS